MIELLNEFSFSNIESIELVTTFKQKDSEQLTKPKILKDFFEYFMENYPSIKIKLNVDNQLHGKIYVSIKDASRSLILGSANFTRSGLQNNHEWGVLINDDAIIEEIVDDFFDAIEYPDVTYTQIINARLIAVEYERDNPEWAKTPDVYSDIMDDVYSTEDSSNTEPRYYLKPVGVRELERNDLHAYVWIINIY
jgi:phosphatidylserine/phosphatidylglycerophosphate/cardiolipin synthase-like enzyme